MNNEDLKTKYQIDDTEYIVTSIFSKNAKKKPRDIIKKMYLDDLKSLKVIKPYSRYSAWLIFK